MLKEADLPLFRVVAAHSGFSTEHNSVIVRFRTTPVSSVMPEVREIQESPALLLSPQMTTLLIRWLQEQLGHLQTANQSPSPGNGSH